MKLATAQVCRGDNERNHKTQPMDVAGSESSETCAITLEPEGSTGDAPIWGLLDPIGADWWIFSLGSCYLCPRWNHSSPISPTL